MPVVQVAPARRSTAPRPAAGTATGAPSARAVVRAPEGAVVLTRPRPSSRPSDAPGAGAAAGTRLDLVALSVATANRYPGSVAAVAVVVVRGGRVVRREEWACRPPAGLGLVDPRRAAALGTTAIALGTAAPFSARLGQLMEIAEDGIIVVPDRDVATSICQACDATGAHYPELSLVSARDLLTRTPLLYGLPASTADLADLDDLDDADPAGGALAAAEATTLVAHRAGATSLAELLRLSRISPTVLDTEAW